MAKLKEFNIYQTPGGNITYASDRKQKGVTKVFSTKAKKAKTAMQRYKTKRLLKNA